MSLAEILVLDSGAGTGKTFVCAEKMNMLLKQFSDCTGLAVRKVRESLSNSVVLQFEEAFCKGAPDDPVHVPSKNRFEYPNGSILAYAGMADAKQRSGLRSIGKYGSIEFVWMEEATEFVEEDFREIQRRCRGMRAGGFRQIMLSTNPESPEHWIFKVLVKPTSKIKEGHQWFKSTNPEMGVERIWWMPDLNPNNDEKYLRQMRNQGKYKTLQMYFGEWVRAEGVVYPEFDFSKHVVDNFPVPRHWKRYMSIDFGFVDPASVIWYAVDPTSEIIYVYREIYHTELNIDQLGAMIRDNSVGENVSYAVADHNPSDQRILRKYGIMAINADKNIDRGLQVVRQALIDGRLKIFAGALCHAPDKVLLDDNYPDRGWKEFSAYVWKQKDGVKTEVPEDKFNHFMDSLRYGLMEFMTGDIGGEVVSRDMVDAVAESGGVKTIQEIKKEMGDYGSVSVQGNVIIF